MLQNNPKKCQSRKHCNHGCALPSSCRPAPASPSGPRPSGASTASARTSPSWRPSSGSPSGGPRARSRPTSPAWTAACASWPRPWTASRTRTPTPGPERGRRTTASRRAWSTWDWRSSRCTWTRCCSTRTSWAPAERCPRDLRETGPAPDTVRPVRTVLTEVFNGHETEIQRRKTTTPNTNPTQPNWNQKNKTKTRTDKN